jgi:glycosyltransferase involved in cell wall biosynthesis
VSVSRETKILYVQYSNPGAYPPVQHSARILAGAGAKILLLGVVTAGTEALRFQTNQNIKVREMQSCRPGIRQKIHYLRFCLWVAWTVLSWRPNWLYASDALASPIAWLLTFWPVLNVIYHEHDTPAEVNPASVASLFIRVILWTRQRVARRANFCVLPNEKRAEHIRRQTLTNRPLYCVWNCPSRQEAPAVVSHSSSDQLTVFYHGSIVPDRLSLNVIRALAELPHAVRLEFAGYETIEHEGYVREILAESERIGVFDRVRYIGALPTRAELLPRCSRAHVGLSLLAKDSQDLSMATMVGASNKPFDYLLCGLALLVSVLPDWEETFIRPQYGLACDPCHPASIAKALRWFLDHPEERQRMGTEGRKRILTNWNYETQFAPVMKRILGSV